MGDQLGEVVPLETAQAWDSARRVREPIAWTRPGVWFILDATDIAAVAAALIFIVAVLRSQASPIRRRRRGY